MRLQAFARLLLVLVLSAALCRANASVIYVNQNAPGPIQDGESWATGYTAVQAGVNAAKDGDELWVTAATYVENITLAKAISLYGGFAGIETRRSERDGQAHATILDGGQKGSVVSITGSGVVLDGFTIRNGYNNSLPNIGRLGGGVYLSGSATITNNVITGNTTYFGFGGGILVNGSALIINNVIRENTAYSGGGIVVAAGAVDVKIVQNTIEGNKAWDIGGGIREDFAPSAYGYRKLVIARNRIQGNSAENSAGGIWVTGAVLNDSAVVDSNVIRQNTAAVSAGGIYAEGANAKIINNLICGNTARGYVGGGVHFMGSVVLANNTIVGNSGTKGGGICGFVSSPATVVNNIVANNSSGIDRPNGTGTVTFSHNDVFGNTSYNYSGLTDPTGTGGNISADPLFVDPASGDYHLKTGSPCVNAGDNSAVARDASDLDGYSRVWGGQVEIGAYEYDPPLSVSVGSSLQAPPAAVDGVVYAGGQDGKIHAFTPDLAPVPGFPVDISAAVGTPVSLNSRPAVYFGSTGKAVYLTTDKGHVVKVLPSGHVAWVSKPLNGPAMSTPAVTPLGGVYVDLGLASGASALNFVFKLDEVSGYATYVSSYLGSSPAGALSDRSAAIDERYAYVNASAGNMGSLAVLNQDNLTVRASFAPGEDALPPYLAGASLFVATKSGRVYKLNSMTMDADLTFGSAGRVSMGEGITAGPFPDASGAIYVGTATGKLWKVDAASGVKALFLDTGTGAAITGLLRTRTGVLAFSVANGSFWQVPTDKPGQPNVTSLGAAPAGGPAYDPLMRRFLVATRDGRLYSIPGL